MDGDHSIASCEEVIGATLKAVFDSLVLNRVVLEKMLLKSGMVLSGKECPVQAGIPEVAEATLRCFRRFVPAAVPGIVFLSGGQSDVAATQRLNAICQAKGLPWRLTFSFGRALQDAAIKAWAGAPANVAAAQAAFSLRAKLNGLAVQGLYTDAMEKPGAAS